MISRVTWRSGIILSLSMVAILLLVGCTSRPTEDVSVDDMNNDQLEGLLVDGLDDVDDDLYVDADAESDDMIDADVDVDVDVEDTLVGDEQNIDTAASQLVWEGRRVLYSYTGTVDFAEWHVRMDNGALVWGRFVLDMTTIALANGPEQLRQHLSSDDFFAVETYPEAILEITTVEPLESETEFDVIADLTIRGITHPVGFVASFDEDMRSATTSLEIDRTLWDVRFGSSNFFQWLGDRVISNTIPFDILIVLE